MYPANMFIDSEPDYQIRIIAADGRGWLLTVYQRMNWKRLSAISHARHYARRHPEHTVIVELAT